MKYLKKFFYEKKYISGICFILALAIAEPIPFGNKMADMPPYFTARILVRIFPSLKDVSMFYLLIPSIILAIIAVLPILERKFNKLAFFLIVIGLFYFPLTIFFRKVISYGYILWFLAPFFFGINLWLRSVNYFYSSAITAVFWDLGAALLAFYDGVPVIGVPYYFNPGFRPIIIIIIDTTIILIFSYLWFIRFNLIKKWNLFETYE